MIPAIPKRLHLMLLRSNTRCSRRSSSHIRNIPYKLQPGYRDITVSAIDILPGEAAIQNVTMDREDSPGNPIDTIVIPAHTLYGDYPPKIPEDEIKAMDESGEIVLSRVVIPEYVVVHDGCKNLVQGGCSA